MASRLAPLVAALSLATSVSAAPTLDVNATAITHLSWVRAAYSGLSPDRVYWMGVFYPANATVTARALLGYPAEAPWTVNAPMKYTKNITNVTEGFYDFQASAIELSCRLGSTNRYAPQAVCSLCT